MTTTGPATAAPLTVPESPAARRTPTARWRDGRLLLGILLVLASVVAGSRVVAGAEHSDLVWAVARGLPAGTRLSADDVVLRPVRLDALAGNYLRAADGDPVGSVLAHALAQGDLVPRSAVAAQVPATVQVTVAVEPHHLPPTLTRGDLVDVLVTSGQQGQTEQQAGASGGTTRAVLGHVPVVLVDDGGAGLGGSSASIGIVLQVSPSDVGDLVGAVRHGVVDLVLDGP